MALSFYIAHLLNSNVLSLPIHQSVRQTVRPFLHFIHWIDSNIYKFQLIQIHSFIMSLLWLLLFFFGSVEWSEVLYRQQQQQQQRQSARRVSQNTCLRISGGLIFRKRKQNKRVCLPSVVRLVRSFVRSVGSTAAIILLCSYDGFSRYKCGGMVNVWKTHTDTYIYIGVCRCVCSNS